MFKISLHPEVLVYLSPEVFVNVSSELWFIFYVSIFALNTFIRIIFYFLHLGSYIMSILRWVQWSVHCCNPKEQSRNSIKDYLHITFKNLDLAIPEASPNWTFHLSQCESFSPYSPESWLSALNLEIWRHSHFSDTQLVVPWTRKFKIMAQSNFLKHISNCPNLVL